MGSLKGRIGIPLIFAVLGLVGVGMIVGAIVVYQRSRTGPIQYVKVDECHYTGTGRGQICTGAWVTGGALVGGNGHVVLGHIEGANPGDVGHTLKVRIHGETAYVGSLRLPIILFVLGLFIAVGLFWAAWSIFASSAPSPPKSSSSSEGSVAGLPTG